MLSVIFQRMNTLSVVAVVVLLLLLLAIVFLIQTMLAPTLLGGTLSQPRPQACVNNKQWLVYDCLRNPITHLGCIVPGTAGKSLTKKSIAVQVSPCLPPPGSENYSGNRVISFVWNQQGEAGSCISSSSTCCNYNSNCTQAVKYLCVSTGQPKDGENQCLPSFLPVPFPDFNPTTNYQEEANKITLQVPCRSNFCKTT